MRTKVTLIRKAVFLGIFCSVSYISQTYTPGPGGVEPVRRAGGRSFFGLSSVCSFCHPSHGVLATQNMRIY